MTRHFRDREPEETEHRKEIKQLRVQVINLLGKLGAADNFVPRATVESLSPLGLELEDTQAGLWVRRSGMKEMCS